VASRSATSRASMIQKPATYSFVSTKGSSVRTPVTTAPGYPDERSPGTRRKPRRST
jgi:hypothetical protein